MAVFDAIKLSWKGVEYTVDTDDSIMKMLSQIEEVLTLGEITGGKPPPMAKMAMAYATALRFAGCYVKDADVYASMFGKGNAEFIAEAVTGLLSMMIPPDHLRAELEGPEPAPKKKAAKKPSKRGTKR